MARSLMGGGCLLAVLALLLVAFWAGAFAALDPRDVQAGQALFARNCSPCHGESGRGDGASAAGFGTKPADLTDGRLMNGVPDGFLRNIIENGGPAEGLAPTMPPFKALLSAAQVAQVVAYVRSLAQPPFRDEDHRAVATAPHAPTQPIFFNHIVHAGSFQLACQYCHAQARRGTAAGLPSVERCMGCHKIIGAQDNPEIAKIHEYARRSEPIPWVRVFKVPEFTYFPHKPHVRAGVACQTCHGPIERMRVVGAETGRTLSNDLLNLVGLRPPPPRLSMGWCIDCHREQNRRGAQAPLECVICHH